MSKNAKENLPFGRPVCRRKCKLKYTLQKQCVEVDLIHLTQSRVQGRVRMNTIMKFPFSLEQGISCEVCDSHSGSVKMHEVRSPEMLMLIHKTIPPHTAQIILF
jgi:hypothetical protein